MHLPHPRKTVPLFLLSLFFNLILAAETQAAPSSAVESDTARVDLATRLNELAPSSGAIFVASTPGDADLGEQILLSPLEKYRSFTLFAGANQFFTTDATLVEDGYGQDWFTTLQVGAIWTPKLAKNLYANFYAREELFRYATYSDLSFNATSLGAGLIYEMPALGGLSLYGRYGYSYLGDALASNRIYDDQTMKFGLDKAFLFGQAHAIYLGTSADIVLAGSPSYALRDQFYATANYQFTPAPWLTIGACYQVGYIPFREYGRRDWNHLVCGSVSAQLNRWLSVSTLISGAFNGSTESYYDYSVLNLGFSVNGTVQF